MFKCGSKEKMEKGTRGTNKKPRLRVTGSRA